MSVTYKANARLSKDVPHDDRFGVCPICHKTDGFINLGREHWFYCAEHKVKWFFGLNIFSSWKSQTAEQQQALYDALNFGEFMVYVLHNCAHFVGGKFRDGYIYCGADATSVKGGLYFCTEHLEQNEGYEELKEGSK
jgi:hypothetical protein